MHIIKIKYYKDSLKIFQHIHEMPFSVLLDSNNQNGSKERFDIMTACPTIRFENNSNKNYIIDNLGRRQSVKYEMATFVKKYRKSSNLDHKLELPFTTGIIGFMSYDHMRSIYSVNTSIPKDIYIPDIVLGLYEWSIVIDHQLSTSYAIYNDKYKPLVNKILSCVSSKKHCMPNEEVQVIFDEELSKQAYNDMFIKAKQNIAHGNCYQINISMRISGTTNSHPFALYKKIKKHSRAGFAGYLNYKNFKIISNSPEKFVQGFRKNILSSPIKGTISKYIPTAHQLLMDSEKDRAENLMITDLIRNDMAYNCDSTSIKVSEFCKIIELNDLLHLQSTVNGVLKKGQCHEDMISNIFPGGSVTGAPKIRAMQISEKLEPKRRSIFCGSIVYFSNNGKMNSNIMIRSILHCKKRVYIWAGSGVTYISNVNSEYREVEDKLSYITNCLKS